MVSHSSNPIRSTSRRGAWEVILMTFIGDILVSITCSTVDTVYLVADYESVQVFMKSVGNILVFPR